MGFYEGTDEFETKKLFKGRFLGIRHLQAFLIFLHNAILYLNRMHVTLSLVAMTNAGKGKSAFPVYNWNESEQSYILSSFFWGYTLMQFPGAYFSRCFGIKIYLFSYMLCTGVLSLGMPYAISWGGWRAFCALRILMGISQGGYCASTMQHAANWSPPKERGVFCGITHTGFDCGAVIAMLSSGFIATSSLGWPGIFYIYGGLCFVWCVIWLFLGANNATSSKLVSAEERLYIQDSLKSSTSFGESCPPVPWRAIFTSKSFYALLITRSICLGGILTLQAECGSYVNGVLKMELKINSLYSALPFLASWFSLYIFAFFSNLLINRDLLSITHARKVFNSIGMWIPAAGMILIGFLDEKQLTLSIVTLIVIISFNASCSLGCIIGPIDMAPNHTEVLSSIVNTVMNCMALLGPLFFGIVVKNQHDRSQWQIAFATVAVLFCLGNIVYLIWGTAEEQAWNAVDYLTREKEQRSSETTTEHRNVNESFTETGFVMKNIKEEIK